MSRKYLKTRLSGLISAAVLIVGAGGCGIIPEEESYPAAPYFVNEEPADYKTAVCLRGDVILTTVLDLRTMPKQKVNLSVDVSDEHFDSFFVSHKEAIAFKEISFKPRQAGVNSVNIPKIIKIGCKALGDVRRFRKEMC